MIKEQKKKTYWSGLVVFVYSILLFCQGVWSGIYYLYIYPAIYDIIPGYDYRWIYAMSFFTKALVLITPIFGGLVLLVAGSWIMENSDKSKNKWPSRIVLTYSCILLFQTIWVLFGYPKFAQEFYRFITTTYIFVNFPRFFILLVAVIPPLVGSILFMVIGLYLRKLGTKTQTN